jgi:hypothetical protein
MRYVQTAKEHKVNKVQKVELRKSRQHHTLWEVGHCNSKHEPSEPRENQGEHVGECKGYPKFESDSIIGLHNCRIKRPGVDLHTWEARLAYAAVKKIKNKGIKLGAFEQTHCPIT